MGFRVFLFDIDATLLRTGGAGRRSMNRAFKELFGIDDAFDGIVPDGNTDPRIFREIFTLRGLEPEDPEAALRTVSRAYERYLVDEMPRSSKARLMPGVHELLRYLNSQPDTAVGLLTGNLEPTARLKLARFDLNPYFTFGAFASDDEDRNALVPIAVRRAEELAGHEIGLGRHVIVIGDSPLDIACALVHGATAVGVATGSYGTAELHVAGGHKTFQNLKEFHSVLLRGH